MKLILAHTHTHTIDNYHTYDDDDNNNNNNNKKSSGRNKAGSRDTNKRVPSKSRDDVEAVRPL